MKEKKRKKKNDSSKGLTRYKIERWIKKEIRQVLKRKRKALWVQNELVQWCLFMCVCERERFKRDSGSRFCKEKIRGERERVGRF